MLILIPAVTRSASVWGNVPLTVSELLSGFGCFSSCLSSNDLSPGSHFSFPSPNPLTQNCHLWISALPSTAITAITGPIHFLFLRGLGVVFSLFRCVIFLNSFFFCLFQLLLLDIVLFSLMTYLCLQNSRFKLCTLTFLVDIFFFFLASKIVVMLQIICSYVLLLHFWTALSSHWPSLLLPSLFAHLFPIYSPTACTEFQKSNPSINPPLW